MNSHLFVCWGTYSKSNSTLFLETDNITLKTDNQEVPLMTNFQAKRCIIVKESKCEWSPQSPSQPRSHSDLQLSAGHGL